MKISATFFLLLTQIGLLAEPVTWPSTVGGNGHMYELITTSSPISWTDARDAALASGGYLATISSNEENSFVASLGNANLRWIGAFQSPGSTEPTGGWAWVTGEPFTFTNWYFNEPNNEGGSEHYIVLWEDGNSWVDNSDFGQSGWTVSAYVIEYDNPIPSDTRTIHIEYDDLNRIKIINYGNGTTIAYVYDVNGNRTSRNIQTNYGLATLTINLMPSQAHWTIGGLIWNASGTPLCIAPGEYTIVYQSLSDYLPLSSEAITIRPNDNLTLARSYRAAFDTWQSARFTPAELEDESISGLFADPTGTGINNFFRYAFNMERNDAVSPNLPTLTSTNESGVNEEKRVVITFSIRNNDPYLHYQIEVSDDMISWHYNGDGLGGPYVDIIATDNGNGTDTVIASDLTAITPFSPRFIRLHISNYFLGYTAVGVTPTSFDILEGSPSFSVYVKTHDDSVLPPYTFELFDDVPTYDDYAYNNFIINGFGTSATVSVPGGFNYETATSYLSTIRVKKSGQDIAWAITTIVINVINLPPSIPTDSNSAANIVNENASAHTTVGIVASSTDPGGGVVIYQLTDSAAGRFQINATTGVVSTATSGSIDYEALPADAKFYNIRIRAMDANGLFSDVKTFQIIVNDIDGY